MNMGEQMLPSHGRTPLQLTHHNAFCNLRLPNNHLQALQLQRPIRCTDHRTDSVESQAARAPPAGRLAACQLFRASDERDASGRCMPASTAHVDMWSGCNVSFVLSRPLHANGEYRIAAYSVSLGPRVARVHTQPGIRI
jgi:hypothetical protein